MTFFVTRGNHTVTSTEITDALGSAFTFTGIMTLGSFSTGGTTTVTISSLTGSMYLNVPSTDNFFFRVNGTTEMDMDEDRLDINDNWLQMTEKSSSPTGSSNIAKIYAKDNGAGKTQLMVIFATGAAQQIAIQP